MQLEGEVQDAIKALVQPVKVRNVLPKKAKRSGKEIRTFRAFVNNSHRLARIRLRDQRTARKTACVAAASCTANPTDLKNVTSSSDRRPSALPSTKLPRSARM